MGIGKVMPVFTLVYPRGFGKLGQFYRLDRPAQFNHVFLQFGLMAGGVASENIGLPLVVDKYGGVYIIPANFDVGGHVVGN
jgi:hypothetical protein